MKEVIIIGGGIGGLATAIRLLSKGFKVTILEKENTLGGKVNIKNKRGFRFDLTASVLMTPDAYINIFKEANRNYEDYIDLQFLDLLYKINYYDKTSFNIYSDSRKMINSLEGLEKGLSYKYFNFLDEILKKYLISKEVFLDKPMIDKNEFLNLEALSSLKTINPLENSYNYISSKIKNEKLKEYLLFKTMYMGINPYTNSNIYSMIPGITNLYGLCYIKGGIYNYILALERLIKELGGIIELNNTVQKVLIENKKVIGVKSQNRIFKGDIVVCNADYSYAVENLFNCDIGDFNYTKENVKNKDYSCSVFMIYLGLKKRYDKIHLHNIYINKNFKDSIESAFKGEIPKNPCLYFYSPSSIDDTLCKKDFSMVNIMVRVPNLSFEKIKWNTESINLLRNNVINTLKNINGLEDIEENIVFEDYLTPLDLKDKFNSYYGNSFGLSHKLTQSLYKRPHIKSKKIEGLYFTGASTHPGNGVSIILEGSKVLSNLIYSDYF